MFVVLGLIPGYVIAKVLHGMGKLRIPRDVEIAGLDYEMMETAKKMKEQFHPQPGKGETIWLQLQIGSIT